MNVGRYLRGEDRHVGTARTTQPQPPQRTEQEPVAHPERHELQAKGEHPAPCARHCEANAFQIVIKNLKAQLSQPEQEPVAWRNAAIRVGEDLSSVGPDGYYDMTAQQWLDWAMEQQPHGKNSLAQPNEFNPDWDAMAVMVEEQQRMAKRIAELEAQPEQEPVIDKSAAIRIATSLGWTPQRTWVGLTEQDLDYLCNLAYTGDEEFALAVQAKLMEKNA